MKKYERLYKTVGTFACKIFPHKILSRYDPKLAKSIVYLGMKIRPEAIVGTALFLSIILSSLALSIASIFTSNMLLIIVLTFITGYFIFKLLYEVPIRVAYEKSLRELRLLAPMFEDIIARYVLENRGLIKLLMNEYILDKEELKKIRLGITPEFILVEKSQRAVNTALANMYRTLAIITKLEKDIIKEELLSNELALISYRELERQLRVTETYVTTLLVLSFFFPLIIAIAILFNMLPISFSPLIIPLYMFILAIVSRDIKGVRI